jgi:hypothetical protein
LQPDLNYKWSLPSPRSKTGPVELGISRVFSSAYNAAAEGDTQKQNPASEITKRQQRRIRIASE